MANDAYRLISMWILLGSLVVSTGNGTVIVTTLSAGGQSRGVGELLVVGQASWWVTTASCRLVMTPTVLTQVCCFTGPPFARLLAALSFRQDHSPRRGGGRPLPPFRICMVSHRSLAPEVGVFSWWMYADR